VAGEVFDGNDVIWVDILHGLMVCNCFLLLTTTVFFGFAIHSALSVLCSFGLLRI
jgi:hypothetical protein